MESRALEDARGELQTVGTTGSPALVLLDLKLPKLDGLEVLRRLRADERTSRVPVVVLTSSREEQDLVSSYNLGGKQLYSKARRFSINSSKPSGN